jgi:hypothetical protein
LLAFSGILTGRTSPYDRFLANGLAYSIPVEYPVGRPQTFITFIAELETFFPGSNVNVPFVVPANATVEFFLFHHIPPAAPVLVPSFTITFVAGDSGSKAASAPIPELFAIGDTYFVQVTVTGFRTLPGEGFSVAATIGIL